ncbi:SIS domain-containing protein [Vibrio tapetis]|uniref:Tagatose-6-phosphate ketose/aldose isomerase n=1 Tax=Vibrio tapetis subsp. tapetis TaxID=1671868 RepID=A0A2N8ZGY6_9VIBR|nr:SIS domain-containing protein [Vibrio tapetis]SON51181.1 tagatose-6-phosphate ketose/aldose isomerase [Vibrio tapetis subsp. tapetis]
MNNYLGYSDAWLSEKNGIHTAQEIEHQPKLWRNLATQLEQNKTDIDAFLTPIFAKDGLRIVLTGAGTSAFAGAALAPFLSSKIGFHVEAVATTDIVSNPEQYLDPSRPTLVVSFARSGNSPESVAAVQLADQLVTDCYHLFLTCNPEGALAIHAQESDNALCVNMPEGSNDKSFAMTSSFTCMLMSALHLLCPQPTEKFQQAVAHIARLCESKLTQWQQATKQLAALPYQRLIVLGSGGFAGLAQEASLKSLELSAGVVTTSFDSSLGFRHGPKFSINPEALVVQFFSSDEYTRLYDLDLYHELRQDGQAMGLVALTEQALDGEHVFELGHTGLDQEWLCFPYIIFAQMLAFEKSLQLGFGPDNPCPSGEVNRVVQGVTIHQYQ